MSPFTIRPAVRGDIKIIAAVAGPSGGGKTVSALRLARGLAGNGKVVVCDSEHGRSQIYSDIGAPWEWLDFQPPFSPDRYIEALKAAEAIKPAVVVVDSISHEYEGEGGLFDIVEAFLEKRAGDDTRKRAALSFSAWDHAKREHKRLLLHMLRMPCHLVLAMRAQDKIDLIREGGQLKAVPKKSLTGLDGWMPICERRLPYEMTCSFLMLPDNPGVPRPLKPMPASMAKLIPLDQPLTEATGAALSRWAGSSEGHDEDTGEIEAMAAKLSDEILELAPAERRDGIRAVIDRNREQNAEMLGAHVAWLGAQVERAKATLAARQQEDIVFSDDPAEPPTPQPEEA